MSPTGRVYCWGLTSVMAFVCCAGLWWSVSCPVCLVTLGDHPVVVCNVASSAGLFWPMRLLSSSVGGGELSGATGMGSVAGRGRGLVGRVLEEQPSAAGLGLAAHKYSSAGWLVGLSVSVGDCV